jgi:hypothetical protein
MTHRPVTVGAIHAPAVAGRLAGDASRHSASTQATPHQDAGHTPPLYTHRCISPTHEASQRTAGYAPPAHSLLLNSLLATLRGTPYFNTQPRWHRIASLRRQLSTTLHRYPQRRTTHRRQLVTPLVTTPHCLPRWQRIAGFAPRL